MLAGVAKPLTQSADVRHLPGASASNCWPAPCLGFITSGRNLDKEAKLDHGPEPDSASFLWAHAVRFLREVPLRSGRG